MDLLYPPMETTNQILGVDRYFLNERRNFEFTVRPPPREFYRKYRKEGKIGGSDELIHMDI